MILIDPSVGSGRFANLLPKGVCELQPCEFADFIWIGNGPDGTTMFGVELKTVPECMSSIISGRLVGEQLPKLIDNTGIAYLMIQGRYRKNRTNNQLQIYNWKQKRFVDNSANMEWDRFVGTLSTIAAKTPVVVMHTEDDQDTCDMLLHLHDKWQKKWDSHNSHIGNYMGIPPNYKGPVPFAAKVLSLIPGLGWKRATHIVECAKRDFGVPTLFEFIAECMRGGGPTTDKGFDWALFDGIGQTTSDKINEYLKQQGGK